MNKNEFSVQEENRFVLGNHLMTSEVKLGRTAFNVTSRMSNEANSFKDIVKKVAAREICQSDKDAG